MEYSLSHFLIKLRSVNKYGPHRQFVFLVFDFKEIFRMYLFDEKKYLEIDQSETMIACGVNIC
jgi:hypothetical protein